MSSSKKRSGDSGAGGDAKRAKSSWQQPVTGNLAPITMPTPAAAPPPPPPAPGGLDMAAIRAQIAARMASLGKTPADSSSNGSPVPLAPSKAPSFLPPASSAPINPNLAPDVAARLAAIKEKIANQQARSLNPYLSGSGALPKKEDEGDKKKGGLSTVAAHPLLADLLPGGSRGATPGSDEDRKSDLGKSSGANRRDRFGKTMAPKFTSVQANARLAASASPAPQVAKPAHLVAPSANPYTAASTSALQEEKQDEELERAATRRAKPTLRFIQKGKYVQQAEALRQEAKMEALRARIAEASKKAGLSSEFEVLERNIKRQPPPDVEWWDAPLLKNKSYDDLDDPSNLLISTDHSLITLYVQHPIPLPAPWEDRVESVRPLMLTKKEQKKMRRQRRAADLRDKQDRQKMGLIPPDPPKVRLANLMKVLTSAAVQDPTKVEARVRREVALRREKHERDNAERQLTPEQKREQKERKKEKEERKGVYGACFKIKYLVNNAHKFKIKANADQLALTGLCIFHPDFALVYVEGSAASIKHYKRLMTIRIDWTEEARPRAEEEVDAAEGEGDEVDAEMEGRMERRRRMEAMQEKPETLADNKCEIVWEGEVPEKSFKRFRLKNVESDREGKDSLGPGKEGIWDVAKKWQWEAID